MSSTKDFFEELKKAGVAVNESQKKAIRDRELHICPLKR